MSAQIVILLSILSGFLLLYFLLKRKLDSLTPKQDPTLLEWIKSTQSEIQKLQYHLTHSLQNNNQNITSTLQTSYQQLHQRLDQATKVIQELKTETGKFSEIGRSMKDLQDFLNSPKLRGNIGEQILGDLLRQVLPEKSFSIQYRFNSGETVDAVIKTASGIISIDSKFPMENFTNFTKENDTKTKDKYYSSFLSDIKKHIKAISQKYINTQEGTLDFALMYIPSESIYYEITALSPQIQEYAQQKRVLAVSPSTFYAFLRTILVSFEGQRIATEAHTILNNLRDIQKTSQEFSIHLSTLQKHITNAYTNSTAITSEFDELNSKINHTSSLPLPPSPKLTDNN